MRASPHGAPFDARSPVPCLLDAHVDPQTLIDHVLVLVLSVHVRAHVRRTLPLYAGVAAAARRGQRRQAAVDRSGRVNGIAAGGLEPRWGSTVRPLCARPIGRRASPRAGRRSCALRYTRACAGDAAARRGWPPLWWGSVLCVYGASRHLCMEPTWRGVVARCVCEFSRLCY